MMKIRGKKVPYQIGGISSKRPWKGYKRGGSVDDELYDPSGGGQIPKPLQYAIPKAPDTWRRPPSQYAEGGEVDPLTLGLANPSFDERWSDRASGAYAAPKPASGMLKALFREGNTRENKPPDRDYSGLGLFGELRGTAPEDTPVAIKTSNPHVQITEGDIERGMDVGMGSGPGVMVGPYGAHMLRQTAREAEKALGRPVREMGGEMRNPYQPHPVYGQETKEAASQLRPEFRDAYSGWQQDARDAQARGMLEMRGPQGSANPIDRDIWPSSGWARGAEGTIQKEIPDLGAKLVPLKGTDKFVLEHPAGDLHKIYDIPPIQFDPKIAVGEGYHNRETGQIVLGGEPTKKNLKAAVSPALHEVQHRIARLEGFAPGSNYREMQFNPLIKQEYFPIENTNKAYVPSWQEGAFNERILGTSPPDAKSRSMVRGQLSAYERSAGETASRNVQNRRAKGYRYNLHPEDSEDITRGLQWIDNANKPRDIKIHDARDLRNIAKSMVKGEDYRTIPLSREVRGEKSENQVDKIMQAIKDKWYPEKAGGGEVGNPPWFVRNEARSTSGMLKSNVPGRTDKLPINVAGGSYVLPADIPSALGQGNTMAGGSILDKMFNRGPYGMNLPKAKAGQSTKMARMSSLTKTRKSGYADGGDIEDDETEDTPIIAAGGEYILSPEQVSQIGGGDLTAGHDILDQFVKQVRQQHIQTLKKLPGPKAD